MIEYKNVAIQFDERMLVNQFDLAIKPGEKVLFNAPSGSGKSTLMKAVLGFVPLHTGEIYVNQLLVDIDNIHDIRKNIAYVSQDVDLMSTTPNAFIEEIKTYKLNKHLVWDSKSMLTYMELLNLSRHLLDKQVSDLSGGERQRIGLLIAFMLDRDILLLDEVTSGLDHDLKVKVYEYIVNSKKTVMIISHDTIWQTDKVREVTL